MSKTTGKTRFHRITGTDICHAHPDRKEYITDKYYVNLANDLLDDFRHLGLDFGEYTAPVMQYSAILLANYMEDIIAGSGQWTSFSALTQQMIGQAVPLYHNCKAEYCPDKLSFAAVRFIVWHAAAEIYDDLWNADSKSLRKIALAAFVRLDEAFGKAPVNKELADDITGMLNLAGEDFLKMRPLLIWIYENCYLTRSTAADKLLEACMMLSA